MCQTQTVAKICNTCIVFPSPISSHNNAPFPITSPLAQLKWSYKNCTPSL